MMEEKNSVIFQFQAISNKLKKKRILKKPNVAEACQQFENLAISCEREELPQYAALSYQAAAMCQNSLGNTSEEGILLLKSSQQFMANHLRWVPSKMVTTDEHLHYSITCFKDSVERLNSTSDWSIPSLKALCAGVTIQMADTLKDNLNQLDEAIIVYEKAFNSFSNSPVEKVYCLQKLETCRIQQGDYDAALKLVNKLIEDVQDFPMSGLKEEVLLNSEITRLLLLLILQPTPQQISSSAALVLEKYAWIETVENVEVRDLQTMLNENGLSMLSEQLFVILQSLVMACQCSDGESLIPLEDDLVPYLTNDQKSLLRTLVKQVLRKSKYQ